MHRILVIARKEFYHIRRDLRSLGIVIAMPIMMVMIYGYAINMDIENITIAIVDSDQSSESRDLISSFEQSTYFTLSKNRINPEDPKQLLRSGEATAILYITSGFGKAVNTKDDFFLGMTIDGSDAALASAVQNYSNALILKYNLNLVPEGFKPPGVRLSPQILYNPDLKSAHFFVPGLVAVILMMISALLTSITIAREKETGTLEQLLTTPVKPREILIGKLLPYVLIAFFDGILVLIFARFLFGVPFAGSYILLLLFGFIYVATALSMGILISTLVKTQQVAMMLALVITMLPSVLLSGFIFAIKNMPLPLQIISNLIPAKFFILMIRGVMLKGAGIETLTLQAVALIAMMIILLTIAVKRFQVKVG